MNVKLPWAGVLLKTVLPTVAGLAALVVIIAALAGFFTEKIPPGQSAVASRKIGPADRTDVVHEVTKQYVEEAVGTLKAANRTQVSAQVLARIVEITVQAGDTVEKGDVLIELDRQKLETQLSQAEASAAAADVALVQAQDDYDRAERMRKRD
ncbi:MAG: biotin/lipoyl-binding protein, partial [Planctomycetota bacterium]